MSTDTALRIQSGEPFAQRIRLMDGKDVWGSLADCEVRAQVRQQRSSTSELVTDLTPALTHNFDGNDIVIDLALTGAQTRELRGGFYDVIISDVGATDARAVVLLYGTMSVTPVVTSAS